LKIDTFSVRVSKVEQQENENKVKTDHINDLLNFKIETTENLTTQEVQLNGIRKDFKDACYKYDKIFLDNLFIPGLVGDHCRYKNFREYIEFSQNSITSLLNFKEKAQNDLKNYKEKFDTLNKTFLSQIDSTEKGIKSYARSLVDDSVKDFKIEIEGLTDRINEIRLNNHKYAADLIKTSNELKN